MSLFRMFAVAAALTLTAGGISGCTCNKAGTSREARPKTHRMSRGKVRKAKMTRRGKRGRGKADVPKVPAKLYFIDKAKFDKGDKDYWVEVTRKVGARAPAKNAVWNLFKGPTEAEKAKGLIMFSSQAIGFQGFAIQGDTATLQLRGGCSSDGSTVTIYEHLSKTLKTFPEIEHVRVFGPKDGVPTEKGDHRPACLEP